MGNSYNGGKGGDGVYQRIINLIPPHKVWIEMFGGSGAVTKHIYAAEQSFIIEVDTVQAVKLKREIQDRAVVINANAMNIVGVSTPAGVDVCIFADPPYLKMVRTCQRSIYKAEWVERDHEKFLQWVRERKEKIIITHPICEMYLHQLAGWNKLEYKYMSRGGIRDDCAWYNYPTPETLHDYSYAGSTRTERQRIERKIDRELLKLSKLQAIERNAIIAAIRRKFDTK